MFGLQNAEHSGTQIDKNALALHGKNGQIFDKASIQNLPGYENNVIHTSPVIIETVNKMLML